MKWVDGVAIGESAEERRRIRQAVQDAIDEFEYRLLKGDPTEPRRPIGILNGLDVPSVEMPFRFPRGTWSTPLNRGGDAFDWAPE